MRIKVNGQLKQHATVRHRIWSAPEQIARLSEAFELMPDDIIHGSTPEKSGPWRATLW